MKYLTSFRTTVKISRYLFRTLALMLWALGALLSFLYFVSLLHQRESVLRQEYDNSYEQAQNYIRHSADITRQLRYMAENRLTGSLGGLDRLDRLDANAGSKLTQPRYSALIPNGDCAKETPRFHAAVSALTYFLSYWKDNFSDAYDLNRVFYIGGESLCLADFSLRSVENGNDAVPKSLVRQVIKFRNARLSDRQGTQYWVAPGNRHDSGSYYVLIPLYSGNKLEALIGIEQTIRLEDFASASNLPIGLTLLDQNNLPLLSLTSGERSAAALGIFPSQPAFFGYNHGFANLVMKKPLSQTALSMAFSLPRSAVIDNLNMLLFKLGLLNLFSAAALMCLTWLFERRMLAPAEKNVYQLEENEQFNRKIVASAPVGISILRISDGANLISNELAHNYLSMLTHEDRQRITHIISGQQVNFVDVITSNNTNLQISFVHSRYRNQNVAICVLVDVSARVRMEESLQDMAAAAEQASQAKSMFLATVSHELRTPLYGIIGNLDLLKNKVLPDGVDRLVMAMSNSSALLLNIISDILDFSKIESEQLKIEPKDYSPRETVSYIVGNYLSLVVKKRLGLYCFIDPDVPDSLRGDPVRLQQVLSNLLNNAIKFTRSGSIVVAVYCRDGYLQFSVRDTGVGMQPREVMRLFDPFVQLGDGGQRPTQGTGLGLAICEKLVNLMDGDIAVESERGIGSRFTIRLPLYQAVTRSAQTQDAAGHTCWLAVRNSAMGRYLQLLLRHQGLTVLDYHDEALSIDDIFLCDDPQQPEGTARATICFSNEHIGPAEEIRPGYWHVSPAFTGDLPLLLNYLYRSEQAVCPALPAPQVMLPASVDNDDILILVVDDHPINRRLLADQLGSLGYQVITANDGLDALNVISRQAVEIILSDVNMPNMDGYQFARALRTQGRVTPVVGVTANALAEEKQRCLDAGMDNCLSKPVTLEVLQPVLTAYSQKVRQARKPAED
ncbi:two-component system sensor histidine kinase RcsC [Sodalis praecaptivus]|uniref:two-component system sensor histidine kinase RcsC n=1 Tax=Sodalis praecaptivus TaxID=1239307 RepID=UPI00280B6015|nr:two-component system sensor histidine kinase RcsC [Sodalis praecaptivus]